MKIKRAVDFNTILWNHLKQKIQQYNLIGIAYSVKDTFISIN